MDDKLDKQDSTHEEITKLLQIESLSGAEIVAQGLTSGWEDLNIIDGAEWVDDKKRLCHARLQAKF